MAVCIPDSDGRTLFHYAAATGKTHVSKYFMEQVKVDDVNMKDGRGITIITALILLIYLNAIQTKRSLESLKLWKFFLGWKEHTHTHTHTHAHNGILITLILRWFKMKKECKVCEQQVLCSPLIQLVFGASPLVCLGVHKVGGVPKCFH